MLNFKGLLVLLLLATSTFAAPAAGSVTSASGVRSVTRSASATSSAASASASASRTTTASAEPGESPIFVSTEPNFPLWIPGQEGANPQPVRGDLGAPVMGPDNIPIDLQNPDLEAPPTTDRGTVMNAKWPFSLSHNRLQPGGWARQQNAGVMPIATAMASVNMRLEPGAVRELHWHKTSEWAYVLKGKTQITSVNADGQNFVSTVGPGDLWFFPAGIPHSLQATADDPAGSEFILVFDDGEFSEDSTFLLTDWLAHVPAEVIQKNFRVNNSAAFSHIPAEELYIFKSDPPVNDDAPTSPQGTIPDPYSFAFSKVPVTQLNGGSVRIVDSTTFKISKTIAAAEITVEPGAIRELHWHPTMDEWSFFLEGVARVTIFANQGRARTFNYQPGDIGYVPVAMGHYVENIGNTTLKFLEIFNTEKFEDISLNQWLALTPPDLVKAHLQLDDETIGLLSKTKPVVISNKS